MKNKMKILQYVCIRLWMFAECEKGTWHDEISSHKTRLWRYRQQKRCILQLELTRLCSFMSRWLHSNDWLTLNSCIVKFTKSYNVKNAGSYQWIGEKIKKNWFCKGRNYDNKDRFLGNRVIHQKIWMKTY